MKILALDLGKFNSVGCIFDSATRKSRFATIATEREQLARLFRKCKADLIVMEACGPSGWINDLARSFVMGMILPSRIMERRDTSP